jgi:hypothetical protein
MRTGARRRGFLQVQWRSRGLVGLVLLALLVGLLQVEIGGSSAGSAIVQLLISPADARKSPGRGPRRFGMDPRGTPDVFQLPAFLPSAQVPAGQPSSANLPEVRAVPHWRPSRPADGRNAPASSPEPGRAWEERRRDKVATPDPGMPHRQIRVPAVERVARGGWDVMVRPAEPQPGAERAKSPNPPSLRLAHAQPGFERALPQPTAMAHGTFHRLRERLSGRPAQGAHPAKVAAIPPGAKPQEKRAASPTRARLPGRRLGGPVIGELLPPAGTFRSHEVLAINLSEEGLQRARDASYQLVERIDLPALGLTISRLMPPETMNAINGRDMLLELLPEGGFTLNRVYAPYRPGAGRSREGASIAARAGKSCPSERCFGSTLINWQPRLATCARNVKVGIIDTGFDENHPAFARVRYASKEFLPAGSTPASDQHGTGVLSLLAGDADSGTPGLIPDASYVIANAFFADADGQPMSDTAQMLQALNWLNQSGVEVVNLSFAGPDDELLHHAVRELTKAGTVVVAAAGNEGPAAPPSYPAGYQEVIAVTAVDRTLAAYRYANRGAHIDLAAPGVDVWTAMPGRLEGPQTGTSFAVPYVTAVVAVTLPDGGPIPGEDALAAKRRALARLQGNVKVLSGAGRDPTFGAGLVQAPTFCGPAAVAVAAQAGASSQPWVGTVQRAVDLAPSEPLVVGSWVSTVRAASGDGVTR